MKKTRAKLSLGKETLARLSDREMHTVAAAAPPTTNETIRCSRAQGSCLTCGPTFCPG